MKRFFEDKKILIIGGTGTIGKSLLYNILKDNPSVVRVFSRDAQKQFELQKRMREYSNIRYLIGDVRDADRLQRAIQDIDYVFHTAAMKHVSSCEYNPFEAVQTNILGTQNVIYCSLNAGVKRTVFTSTDKAISPTNMYGASKLMAERLVATAQFNSGAHDTVFAAVRFGNVIGSRGSVVPLFRSQIEKHRKITVTDLNMSRFMMSIQQAAKLTIEAMQKAKGGEIFVLKMPVINMGDLVKVLIPFTAENLKIPAKDISVEIIGLRPGEKMYEELMTTKEAQKALELEHMYIINHSYSSDASSYPDAARTKSQNYSSSDIEPISHNKILSMLQDEYENSKFM